MLDLLIKRRSIRKYKNKEVESEKIDRIIKAALLSPSSRNIRPWEFIVVKDKSKIERLSKSKIHGSSFVSGAPLVIVVIADGSKSDVWVEDTSIASIIIQLEAEDLELGSCWIQIRNRKHGDSLSSEDYIKEILNIPSEYKVESFISIGYPDEIREKNDIIKLSNKKIHYEVYE